MENFDRTAHWEQIYHSKALSEVSWYQPVPQTSIDLITKYAAAKNAKIIDVGGGDSHLVDHLLKLGYSNITVLDISSKAIDRAKKRLGSEAQKVTWIVSDITDFKPTETYDVWHDRAAFHFLVEQNDINAYKNTLNNNLSPNGFSIIGTFSKSGPKKCSGISIKQYSEATMVDTFRELFTRLECLDINHKTPFDTIQNFVFCVFKKDK